MTINFVPSERLTPPGGLDFVVGSVDGSVMRASWENSRDTHEELRWRNHVRKTKNYDRLALLSRQLDLKSLTALTQTSPVIGHRHRVTIIGRNDRLIKQETKLVRAT
ncbi:hypothetical protein GCM10009069_23130 [Algimonas arctica]|uniref:Uncharacterized protein n=1 Tax=Algimonas arctica TaxID=1479486 RepID=A0A8J3CTQ6_9PROT|nr:hypothetical protein GCM10009069_23130 [Algimonas arctica]